MHGKFQNALVLAVASFICQKYKTLRTDKNGEVEIVTDGNSYQAYSAYSN